MKELLIYTIIFFIISMTIIVLLSDTKSGQLTISQAVARKKSTTVAFGIATILVTLGSTAFQLGWLAPHFDLSPFAYVFGIGWMLCGILIAIFPHVSDEKSRSAKIHLRSAWLGSFMIMAMDVDILIESFPAVTLTNKILLITLLVYAVIFRIIFNLTRFRKFRLVTESVWLGLWVLILISLAYFN